MLSIIRLCFYQIKGRSIMYGLSCGFLFGFILFAVICGYGLQNGTEIITDSGIKLLMGVFLPFFSCFMILPFAEEIMNTEVEETTFLYRNKINVLFLIQNLIYYFLILTSIVLFGRIYASVYQISYQIFYLCIYLQLFAAACYFVTRSNFATCAILFFYLSVTLAFSLLGNQDEFIYPDAANVADSLGQELSFGWLTAYGGRAVLFFKAQGWKMIVAALAAVLSVVNRRQLCPAAPGRFRSDRKFGMGKND